MPGFQLFLLGLSLALPADFSTPAFLPQSSAPPSAYHMPVHPLVCDTLPIHLPGSAVAKGSDLFPGKDTVPWLTRYGVRIRKPVRIARLQMLPDTISILGTGDIMPGTNYPNPSYLPPGNDCSRLFDPVRETLQRADLTFGNLEGVFASRGGQAKKCNNPKTCYVFRMPDAYLECILDAGYDLLSVANNHVNDFGAGGRRSTAALLEAQGVPFAGFADRPSVMFRKESLLIGFAAFAPHTGTARLKDYEGAARIVAALDDTCDIVIVSFHGGAEGRDHQHVPCTDEVYLGYNRGNVCKFAHSVVDAGADVVFGHGPHVTRALELYRDRLICYSLGNFCTYARFNLSGPNGLAPMVQVNVAPDGRFLDGIVYPVYQPGEGGPRPDPYRRVIPLLRTLSAEDFPGSPVQIDEDGRITRKENSSR